MWWEKYLVIVGRYQPAKTKDGGTREIKVV